MRYINSLLTLTFTLTVKEPAGLCKRQDGVTLLPWAKGKPLAWDITVPDIYADSHLADTATTAGAAARRQVTRKLANSHIFVPIATESARTWNHQAQHWN